MTGDQCRPGPCREPAACPPLDCGWVASCGCVAVVHALCGELTRFVVPDARPLRPSSSTRALSVPLLWCSPSASTSLFQASSTHSPQRRRRRRKRQPTPSRRLCPNFTLTETSCHRFHPPLLSRLAGPPLRRFYLPFPRKGDGFLLILNRVVPLRCTLPPVAISTPLQSIEIWYTTPQIKRRWKS